MGQARFSFSLFALALFLPYRLQQAKQYALQTVTLDERRPSQLVNFVPVSNPARTGQGLLAVLWGLNPEGQYQVIYSSMFNDSVFPHPVSTLDFPGTPYRMALISSEDSEQKYLHYRLVGYRSECQYDSCCRLCAWWQVGHRRREDGRRKGGRFCNPYYSLSNR